jgi:hypothetical protein
MRCSGSCQHQRATRSCRRSGARRSAWRCCCCPRCGLILQLPCYWRPGALVTSSVTSSTSPVLLQHAWVAALGSVHNLATGVSCGAARGAGAVPRRAAGDRRVALGDDAGIGVAGCRGGPGNNQRIGAWCVPAGRRRVGCDRSACVLLPHAETEARRKEEKEGVSGAWRGV